MAHKAKSTPEVWQQAKAIALRMLRRAYRQEIERLTEEVRSRLESGELHGYTDADDRRETSEPGEKRWMAPLWAWEKEIEAAMMPTFPDAYLVLAVSPSEDNLDGATGIVAAKNLAAECVSHDVLRHAVSRGWYRPAPDEYPTETDLALDGNDLVLGEAL